MFHFVYFFQNKMVFRPILRHLYQSNIRTGDFSDKLNSTWTVLLLVVSSFLAWYYTFEKEPITCWAPAHSTMPMVRYMHKICWEADEYYHPLENVELVRESKSWKPVYKWLPLILFLQALLFKVPDVILSVGQGWFGFKFKKVLGLTDGYASLNFSDRRMMARQIGRYVKNWLRSSTIKAIPWGPLTGVFLLVKLLYAINIITQISYLDNYLRVENETSYGEMLANDITLNETSEWRLMDSKFPKIVLCDFSIFQLQSRQIYTIQCMLNFTTFYEGLYGLIWVWFVFTALVTCFSCVLHVLKIIVPIFRKRYKHYIGIHFLLRCLYKEGHIILFPSNSKIRSQFF